MPAPARLKHLFIDLNSFFASVEQHVAPRLRGKPVAVAPISAPTGCCIAASYEAKARGVKTGTSVGDARRLCPDITIVHARPRLYVLMHHRILKAVDTVLPVHKVRSIDEMDCLLDATQRTPERAEQVAHAVKQAIYKHCGPTMRCSVGVAPNQVLAKLGTDLMKPDGLVILRPEDLPGKIAHLSPQELSGIGPRMMHRLHRAGIDTIAQLCERDAKELRRLWGGVVGERWWHWLRGEETFEPPTRKGTVGHQHVLAPELRTTESARAVAYRLALKAAARLRHEGFAARKLALGLSFADNHAYGNPWGGTAWGRWAALGQGCVDTPTMLDALDTLWARVPPGKPVLVSVTLLDLVYPRSQTLPLFEHERRREGLSRAMDKVNQKFGANTLYTANMHGVRDHATGGIAFASVPDLALADSVRSRQRGTEEGPEDFLSDHELNRMLDEGLAREQPRREAAPLIASRTASCP
jgi:DNA polymerase-4